MVSSFRRVQFILCCIFLVVVVAIVCKAIRAKPSVELTPCSAIHFSIAVEHIMLS